MIEINAGFLPLTDSAILVAAKEMGFAEKYGIALSLMRETSWANIRDRLAVGQFEMAHCLAPIPLAANLGLSPFSTKLIAPMALGLGGNAVTVSNDLYDAISEYTAINPMDASETGIALAKVVQKRRENGHPRLQFGVVHAFSAHNFELRYWLAACGITPDVDVDISILPPPIMADALNNGQIDGFCVGEPWNSIATNRKSGKIITVKSAIWASSPEKVLAVDANWAQDNEQPLNQFLRALYEAEIWCSQKNNLEELAKILARPNYLGISAEILMLGLNNTILSGAHQTPKNSETLIDRPFFEPHKGAATFPWQSHALWLYSQMVRWGQIEHSPENVSIAQSSFRPDIYRAALSSLDAVTPTANSKVEGALLRRTPVGAASQSLYLGPDGFFDGKAFDPDKIEDYITSQRKA